MVVMHYTIIFHYSIMLIENHKNIVVKILISNRRSELDRLSSFCINVIIGQPGIF